jgi:ParB/RepB/Spo0J family partition protein
MKRRTTIDLEKFAADAKAEKLATEVQLPSSSQDEKLELLLRNIGKTVLLSPHLLVIQDNIRQMIDLSSPEFQKLVNSIHEHGVKQNLIGDLRVLPDAKWQIVCVAGQRRLLAALKAGREQVPVRIEQYNNDAARLVDALSENLLRANLHCLDTALGYFRLLQAGWTENQIAEAFERQRDTVMKMLRLARFPAAAHNLIRTYPNLFTSTVLLTKFVAKSWPSEAALLEAMQQYAAKSNEKNSPALSKATDDRLKELVRSLEKRGIKTAVKGTLVQGQLLMKWNNEEEWRKIAMHLAQGQGN